VTNIGPVYAPDVGYLRGSPGGGKIAAANFIVGTIDIFDFDKNTGLLSNSITISGFVSGDAYGIEFSPNSTFLYVGEYYSHNINQYNLLAGSNAAIISSGLSIGQSTQGNIGALQLGPDGKIYLSIVSASNLAVIDNPDIFGLGCNFNVNGPQLAGRISWNGLPTFYSSIFVPTNTFSFNNTCVGDSSFFNLTNTYFDSILWDFGDPNSGIDNNSTDFNPFHIFTDTGTFHINLYSYFNGITDTVTNNLFINNIPIVNLGNDTVICDGEILTLDANAQNATYLWQNNSTNSTYDVMNVGDYSVIITDSNGCINSDTIHVVLNPLPYIDLGNDIEICENDVLTLDVYFEEASYLWNDNSTISSHDIYTAGVYSVILTDSNGCSNSDTINVIINPLPNSDFIFNPQPTDLNNPNILFSNISSANTSYEWNLGDGTTIENLNNINHTYQFSGEYDVSLISLNEFDCIDTAIYQIIIDPGGFDLFIPKAFTPNNDEHNELFVIKGRYIIDFNIKIFNRWGKKIFESNNIKKYWDGRFHGKLVQQEKYAYLVTVVDVNAYIHEFPGIINVIY
jgi:gliding motility-associated-like protein